MSGNRPDWIQVSALNELTLFWTALHLKIWFLLTDEQRADLKKLKSRDDRIRDLQTYGRKLNAAGKFQHLRQEFLAEIEKAEGRREDGNLAKAKKKVKEATDKKNPVPPLPPIKPNPNTRKAELNFLREHKPAPVDQAHLTQFEEECPSWLRESLEPLPPDAARRRLVILYRMVFPAPDEIPPPKPKPKPPKSPAEPPQPGTGPGIR